MIDKMPSLFQNMHFKTKTKSESEKIFPNRYLKQEINFKEYLAIHNSQLRKYFKGKKLYDKGENFKKSVKEKSSILI